MGVETLTLLRLTLPLLLTLLPLQPLRLLLQQQLHVPTLLQPHLLLRVEGSASKDLEAEYSKVAVEGGELKICVEVGHEFAPVRLELGEARDAKVEGEGTELELEILLNGEMGETIEEPVVIGNGQAGMMGGESGRTCRLPAREGAGSEPEGGGMETGQETGEGGGNKTSEPSSATGGALTRPSTRLRIA